MVSIKGKLQCFQCLSHLSQAIYMYPALLPLSFVSFCEKLGRVIFVFISTCQITWTF